MLEVLGAMILIAFGPIIVCAVLTRATFWVVEAYKQGWKELRAG